MAKSHTTNQPAPSDVQVEIAEGESIFDDKTRRFYRKGDEGQYIADAQPDEAQITRLQELGILSITGQVAPGHARMPDPTLVAGRSDPDRTGEFGRSLTRPEHPPALDTDDISEETSGIGAGRYAESRKVRGNADAASRRAGGRGKKAESGE